MPICTATQVDILEALTGGTAFSPAGVFVQLHIGDPGADATANVADETTRQEATSFAAAGSGGGSSTITNDADVAWTSVAADETYSFISLWDDDTAGTALWYGALTDQVPVTMGDDFTIASGDLTVTLT